MADLYEANQDFLKNANKKGKRKIKKPMSQKKFLDGLGDDCPNCGGHDILADPEWNADSGVVSRKVWCQSCPATWVEYYNLAGYDNLDK